MREKPGCPALSRVSWEASPNAGIAGWGGRVLSPMGSTINQLKTLQKLVRFWGSNGGRPTEIRLRCSYDVLLVEQLSRPR